MNELVVISAVWCPSCLILKKHIKKLKEEYQDIEIELLDYDFDSEEVEKYEVGNKLPVIITTDNDKETSRLIGEKTYEEIIDFLEKGEII